MFTHIIQTNLSVPQPYNGNPVLMETFINRDIFKIKSKIYVLPSGFYHTV